MALDLPFRQIHLDFHTGPAIGDVARDFDADAFGDRLAEARVNSVTLFAKCHHGHLYYDTKHPSRHPGMKKGVDLLGEQLEACRKRGIRAPIYISVQCDEYVANNYADWIVVKPDGGLHFGGPLSATWHIVDMSSPYADYLGDQIAEVLRKFKPVDGIFLDMCWDQPSVSKWAIDGMRRENLNPENEGDRAAYAKLVSFRYMERYKKQIESAHRGRPIPVAFNSRRLHNLAEEKRFLRHVEIEALPSGGWGYMYFPLNVRYVRPFGLPYMGMTARFHKSWADFGGLKPEAALFYECAQMLAHGAQCSIGDQLHPRGILDKASYQLIGRVYKHVEACEPWCDGAKSKTQIGVIFSVTPGRYETTPSANEGVVKALQQLRHQFDFLPPDADLSGYEMVIVPEHIVIDAALKAKLSRYVKAGGALLVAGKAALDDKGRPAMRELGIATHGSSPFTTTYLRFDRAISDGVAPADHVVYERGERITAARGGIVLGRVVEPYFERHWSHFSSHNQTPGDKVSRFAAAVQKGRVVTIAYPAFSAYADHGNVPLRQFIGACINRVLPEPLVRAGGPSFLETTVTTRPKQTIVHLLAFAPQRRTQRLDIVEDATPLVDMPLSVKLSRKPRRVTMEPGGKALEFTYADGRATVRINSTRGHEMVVFEKSCRCRTPGHAVCTRAPLRIKCPAVRLTQFIHGVPPVMAKASAKQPTRYAIVGTGGRIVNFIDPMIGRFGKHNALVGFCDTNQGRMDFHNKRIAEKFNHPPVPTYLAKDFDRMIKETKPDTVIVCTVDAFHHDYIIRSLHHGCDVVTEKPMTIDDKKCRAIFDAVKKTRKSVRVTFNYRWTPGTTLVKQLLSKNIIGDIVHVDFEYLLNTSHGADYFRRWHREKDKSGGLLVHKSTHHFDVINWWIDSVPEEVFGYGKLAFYGRKNAEKRGLKVKYDRYTGHNTRNDPFALDLEKHNGHMLDLYRNTEKYDGYIRDRNVFGDNITIEDSMSLLVKYRTGIVLNYSLNAYLPREGFHAVINGTKGRLEYSEAHGSHIIAGQSDKELGEEMKWESHCVVHPMFGKAYKVEIPKAKGGHGGSDPLLTEQIFSPKPPKEKWGRNAGHEQGAASILIGIAGNHCYKSGKPVSIAKLCPQLGKAKKLSALI